MDSDLELLDTKWRAIMIEVEKYRRQAEDRAQHRRALGIGRPLAVVVVVDPCAGLAPGMVVEAAHDGASADVVLRREAQDGVSRFHAPSVPCAEKEVNAR